MSRRLSGEQSDYHTPTACAICDPVQPLLSLPARHTCPHLSPVLAQLPQAHGGRLQALAQVGSHKGRGRLLKDLLVAALQCNANSGTMHRSASVRTCVLTGWLWQSSNSVACSSSRTSQRPSKLAAVRPGPCAAPGWSTRARGRPPHCRRHRQRSGPRCGGRAAQRREVLMSWMRGHYSVV